MAKEQKTFVKGRMNKSVDERLLPDGEYIDALNVRLGSTELSEVGAVENTKGNVKLTTLKYNGVALSGDAICIGALDDSSEETMYWFVHDPNHSYGGVVDMIVSFNTQTQQLTYHVVTTALLNFNPTYLMNAVDKIDDLLFFTDDYNPPRKINVTRAYPQPILNIDQIVELDISVIKPQPMEAPMTTLESVVGGENYIEDSFICFAYRYQYKDGEYSALSQFTQPVFSPSLFSLDISSYLNAGMVNTGNSVEVSFNTGSSNVIAIDIVFKESDSNVIYVIDKKNKQTSGYQDDSIGSITFRNGDIYTILNSGEILRLYDNVPRLAKAQSIMGNRLMYGNYLEGRDIVDSNGNDINIDYSLELVSKASTIISVTPTSIDPYDYYIDNVYSFSNPFRTVPLAKARFDLSSIGQEYLRSGSEIVFEATIIPWGVRGQDLVNNTDIDVGSAFSIEMLFTVDQDYQSIFDVIESDAWRDKVGMSNNYQTDPNLWSQGLTFTDGYNFASIPPTVSGNQPPLEAIRSGRGDSTIPCYENSSPNTSSIYIGMESPTSMVFIPNAIQYAEIPPLGDPNKKQYYQFFSIQSAKISFTNVGDRKSLHSNRSYEVGIVYQDKEGRQTTSLVSGQNSLHNEADNSDRKNTIKVNIPASMPPPVWADRYKFVMKQSHGDYETVFFSIFYVDPIDKSTWLKVEGEHSNKISIGQEFFVKRDSNGPVDRPVKATVLDVKSQASDFIVGNDIEESAGLYIKTLPNEWAADYIDNAVFNSSGSESSSPPPCCTTGQTRCPAVLIPCYNEVLDPLSGAVVSREPWSITAGSIVDIKIRFRRRRYDNIGENVCGDEKCVFKKTIISTSDYPNMWAFWIGEGVNVQLANCDAGSFQDSEGPMNQIFYPYLFEWNTSPVGYQNVPTYINVGGGYPNDHPWIGDFFGQPVGFNRYQFSYYAGTYNQTLNPDGGKLYLGVETDVLACQGFGGSGRRESTIEYDISIRNASSLIVFETIPTKTNDEIYYENEQSFPIVNGFHISGDIDDDQDQTALQPAIVNLTFFNCFQFSNGVESYKIKDSITGKKFYLGNRVTSVSEQDYKEIRRGSSITYSGVYNQQNNINRLNEFNLGLANYKDCEESYGPIQVLHGRRTDLLTLQEDRISYISLGKNLLVDADGGGVLTSVPEILGTQVARIEEYGISENPESFAHYGSDIYFTDAKRSAVIQLKGGTSSESLISISNDGMRSWFRDLFQTSFDYQKLGGYDPYMDEYVLSPNTNRLPFTPQVYGCGGGARVFTGLLNEYSFTIDAGRRYGEMIVEYETSDDFTVTATYNGTTFNPTPSGPNTYEIVFDKDIPSIETILITVTPNTPSSDSVISITIGCPRADIIRIVPVVITSATDAGKLIHNSYNYIDTTVTPNYQSGFQGSQIQFISQNQMQYASANIVSQFGPMYSGPQGSGSIPVDNSVVYMYSTKLFNDTFDFDVNKHNFRYLRTATEYENNAIDIAALLALTPVANGGSAPAFFGNFTMPSGGNGDYLYLIWDYRENQELKLCYSSTPSVSEACCECFSSQDCVPFLGTTVELTDTAACGLTPTTTYYTSTISVGGVTNTEPILGTTVYSYLGCSSGNVIGAGYIKLTDNTWVETDSNGVVINTGSC